MEKNYSVNLWLFETHHKKIVHYKKKCSIPNYYEIIKIRLILCTEFYVNNNSSVSCLSTNILSIINFISYSRSHIKILLFGLVSFFLQTIFIIY